MPSRRHRPRLAGYIRRGLDEVLAFWPVRGYREADAGHLVSIIAYNALIALVPTFLLLVSIAGLLLRQDRVLRAAVDALVWALPSQNTRDALTALLTARRHTGWFGLASLLGFAWVGSNFVNALAHAMNRVYAVPDCGYFCSRRRGFAGVLTFAILFLIAAVAATVPTLFVGHTLNPYFQTWLLAAGPIQVGSYGLAYAAAALLFLVLYRVLPNAGQHLDDVWPGALVAGGLFVLLGQAFPLYLRFVGGSNRYGAALGLVWLLVTWFGLLAHVLLFGTYVNVTYYRARHRQQARRPVIPSGASVAPGHTPRRPRRQRNA